MICSIQVYYQQTTHDAPVKGPHKAAEQMLENSIILAATPCIYPSVLQVVTPRKYICTKRSEPRKRDNWVKRKAMRKLSTHAPKPTVNGLQPEAPRAAPSPARPGQRAGTRASSAAAAGLAVSARTASKASNASSGRVVKKKLFGSA